MSFVGPRPAVFNQDDLIEFRTQAGVHKLQPGLTGWEQINGRDETPIPDKVKLVWTICWASLSGLMCIFYGSFF